MRRVLSMGTCIAVAFVVLLLMQGGVLGRASLGVTTATTPLALADSHGLSSALAPRFDAPSPASICTQFCVVANISVGSGPIGLAYDASDGDVYVDNEHSNNVSIVNATSNIVVGSVTVGNMPWGAVYDALDHEVYVTNNNGVSQSTISLIKGFSVVANITVGSGSQEMAYDSANDHIYVSNWATSNVSVINGSTGMVQTTINGISGPVGETFDSENGNVYVANFVNPGTVTVLRGNSVLTTIRGLGSDPQGVTFDPVNGDIYVVNQFSSNVSVINGSTDTKVASIPAGLQPWGITCDVGSGDVFVADGSNNITVISGTTVIASIKVANVTSVDTGNVLYDPTNGDIYATTYVTGRLYVISPGPTSIHIASFTASPNPVSVGGTTYLNVSATGGSGILHYAFTGLPSGCTSMNQPYSACTPLASGTYVPRVFANDSVGGTSNDTLTLVVRPTPPPTLSISAVSILPNPIEIGLTVYVNVSVSGGVSPYTFAYKGLPTGCISANQSALPCTPTTLGVSNVTVIVTDSEGQRAVSTPFTLTVVKKSLPSPQLSLLRILPSSATVYITDNASFTALPTCLGGDCPTGISYVWALNATSLGSLSSQTGNTTVFYAKSDPGVVRLEVVATLSGLGKNATVNITVERPSHGHGSTTTTTTFLGLPGAAGYVLVGALAGIVAGSASFLIWKAKKPRRPRLGVDEPVPTGALAVEEPVKP